MFYRIMNTSNYSVKELEDFFLLFFFKTNLHLAHKNSFNKKNQKITSCDCTITSIKLTFRIITICIAKSISKPILITIWSTCSKKKEHHLKQYILNMSNIFWLKVSQEFCVLKFFHEFIINILLWMYSHKIQKLLEMVIINIQEILFNCLFPSSHFSKQQRAGFQFLYKIKTEFYAGKSQKCFLFQRNEREKLKEE